MNTFNRVVWMACLCFFLSGALLAQSDLGTISGYVKDPSGATVPNAKVTVTNPSGIQRGATTNDSGYYSITNIPPGFYTLTVEASGFQRYESKNNKLDPSGHLTVDTTLTLGAATQTVEVTASTVALQTESVAVQKLVTREQINSLELNGRNPVGLASLVPGARGGSLSGRTFAFGQGPSNFNGSRNPENLITYDGAPATRTRSNGTSLGSADVDSTQEVQILTANYAAEYGRSSGAQIRIVTKSGTQEFHGSAYEYLQNQALNANSWQRNLSPATRFTPPFHYNQFGYNAGGPFFIPDHFNTGKNKIFWYWGQEWVRYVFTDERRLRVPSAKMRTGDFSELLTAPNLYYDTPKQIIDPMTGLPFSGNIIPQCPSPVPGTSCASANGLGILRAYPDPNQAVPLPGNNNWFFAAKHPENQRKDTIAVDVNLTDKQRLRFRRLNYTFFEYQPLDGGTNETPKFFDRPNQTNSLNHIWTISPTKVNEFLATASLDVVRIPVDAAHFRDRRTGGLNYPYIFTDGKLLPNRIPTVNMSSMSTLSGGPYPSRSSGPIYGLSDSYTWIKGNHAIKFGALFERAGENDNDEINVQACTTCTNNQNGQFAFTDTRSGRPSTGVAAANAALGLFDRYSEIGHRAYTLFRANMWEGFAQDGWSATPKLHVDYGVRYTVIVPYHAIWRNMIVFDPRFYDPSKAVRIDPTTGLIIGTIDPRTGLVNDGGVVRDAYNGMVIPGSGFPSSVSVRVPEADSSRFDFSRLFRGVPDYYSNIQWGQIQPRLGIAYRLGEKNVIRAGAGRFFTRLGVSDSIFLGGNPPFQPNASIEFGSVDNLTGGLNNVSVVTTQTRNFRNPEAWNWNFTFEREFLFKTLLSVAYVGRRGLHLQREANINQPTVADVAAAKGTGTNLNALRPYKGFGSIRQTDNIASSRYNAFQLNWTRRMSNGLAFGLAYTLSKSMDDGSNQRDVVPYTYDTRMLWGPSEFDARHVFIVNYIYTLPFFRDTSKLSGKLLGGWQISGITQFQTGTPCGVTKSNDYAGVGLDANFGCPSGQFWVVNGDPKIIGTFGSAGQWFATKNPDGSSVFTAPPTGTFNSQRVRGVIYQPGFQNWNLGLFKAFPINERAGLQFRAEAFNFINHPNWGGTSGGGVNFDPTSPLFGKVTSKGSERNMQLSLRLYF